MADDTTVNPIADAEPPKANPLAKPAAAHGSTVTLKPVARPTVPGVAAGGLKPGLKLPPKPGVTATGLKPGLKLPTKPGVTATGLKPGLKLPTKPGVTATGLKPGLKLPTKPGVTATGLKPGVKLPTKPIIKTGTTQTAARPVIHKPGTAPATVVKAPTAAAPATPAAPAAPAAPAEKPLDTLKTITANLKSVTAPIPQQAVLRKTGIIADAGMSEAQKQAAKAKTARISLSDAMGVAPVKNEALPMKTIRIKRPVDIPGATGTSKPFGSPAPAAAPAAKTAPAAPAPNDAVADLPPVADLPAGEAATTVTKPSAPTNPTASFTQRKTLKVARPGSTVVRPAGKFGLKKPGGASAASTVISKPAAAKPAGKEGEVADIPDMPSVPTMSAPVPMVKTAEASPVCTTIAVILQVAACVAIGALAWFLYQDTQIMPY